MAERTSIRLLFLHQMVKEKAIFLNKVSGEKNRADLLTKPVTRMALEKLRPSLGLAVAAASAAFPLWKGQLRPLIPEFCKKCCSTRVCTQFKWPSVGPVP